LDTLAVAAAAAAAAAAAEAAATDQLIENDLSVIDVLGGFWKWK